MRRSAKRERGTVLVLIASGLVMLLGAVGLSVDLGYVFTFRNQLQNAVDAAALAGAQGLLADPGDFSESGRAKQLAIEYAARNAAGQQPVRLDPGEITFPTGDTIKIEVTRPAETFFMRVLGIPTVNVHVAAAARIMPAIGGGGLRPFAVLDQFGHGPLCVPPNDESINHPPHGAFKDYPHEWMGVQVDSDHYASPYDPEFNGWDLSTMSDCSTVTGLIAPRDVDGQLIELKVDRWLTPGNFGPAALGQHGADVYEENIIYGYQGFIQVGDILETEPGNMIGPTQSGVDALIAQDPTARMVRNSSGNWVVISDDFPMNESPRIIPIPMYSVHFAPSQGRSEFQVASIGSFFIERIAGRTLYGRFVQSRLKNARSGNAPRNASGQTVSGGGRLLGAVKLIDPESIP